MSATNLQIGRAAITVSLATLLVSLLSVLKNMVTGYLFGAWGDYDAFVIAFTLPTVVSGVILSAIQVTLTPVFIEHQVREGQSGAFSVFNAFCTLAILFFLAGTCVLEVSADGIVRWLAPGFASDRLRLATELFRVTAPLLLLNGLIGLAIVLLNAYRHFALTALSPGLGTIVGIIYILTMRQQGIYSLAFGLLVGGTVQFTVLLISMLLLRFPVRPLLLWNNEVRRIIYLSGPLMLSTMLTSINPVVDQLFASTLPSGSVARLNYAGQIHNLSVQITALALSTAIFPYLSDQVVRAQLGALQETVLRSARMLSFLLAPLSVLIVILGQPVVQLLLERGAFDHTATTAVARAWGAFALGLISTAFGFLLARVYNALQESRTLLLVAPLVVGCNIVLDYLLLQVWAEAGIALSTSLVYTIASILLLILLQRKIKLLTWSPWRSVFQSILIAGLMALGMMMFIQAFNASGTDPRTITNLGSVASAVLTAILGIGIFLLLSKYFRVEELDWLLALVQRESRPSV